MALRYARLVSGSRTFAAAASFAAKQKRTYDDLCATLKRYNEDVVKALKADPQNNVTNAQFLLCAELTSILFSDEEAELLRRRGRAAGASGGVPRYQGSEDPHQRRVRRCVVFDARSHLLGAVVDLV